MQIFARYSVGNDLSVLAADGDELLLTIPAAKRGVFLKITLSFLENKVDRVGAELSG